MEANTIGQEGNVFAAASQQKKHARKSQKTSCGTSEVQPSPRCLDVNRRPIVASQRKMANCPGLGCPSEPSEESQLRPNFPRGPTGTPASERFDPAECREAPGSQDCERLGDLPPPIRLSTHLLEVGLTETL